MEGGGFDMVEQRVELLEVCGIGAPSETEQPGIRFRNQRGWNPGKGDFRRSAGPNIACALIRTESMPSAGDRILQAECPGLILPWKAEYFRFDDKPLTMTLCPRRIPY